jgi:hypothetical protein
MNLHSSVAEALDKFHTHYELVPEKLHYHQEGREIAWVVVSKGYQLDPYTSPEEIHTLHEAGTILSWGPNQLEARAGALCYLMSDNLHETEYIDGENNTRICTIIRMVLVVNKGLLFTIEEYTQWLREAAGRLISEAENLEAAFCK